MNNITIQRIPAAVQKDRSVLLKIGGELIIQNVGEARQQLMEIMSLCKSVRIELQNVTSLDLAFIQVLVATLHTGSTLQKKVTLEAQLPEELQLIVKNSGFAQLFAPASRPNP